MLIVNTDLLAVGDLCKVFMRGKDMFRIVSVASPHGGPPAKVNLEMIDATTRERVGEPLLVNAHKGFLWLIATAGISPGIYYVRLVLNEEPIREVQIVVVDSERYVRLVRDLFGQAWDGAMYFDSLEDAERFALEHQRPGLAQARGTGGPEPDVVRFLDAFPSLFVEIMEDAGFGAMNWRHHRVELVDQVPPHLDLTRLSWLWRVLLPTVADATLGLTPARMRYRVGTDGISLDVRTHRKDDDSLSRVLQVWEACGSPVPRIVEAVGNAGTDVLFRMDWRPGACSLHVSAMLHGTSKLRSGVG